MAKAFAGDTFDPIAFMCKPHMFFSDDQTETRLAARIGSGENEHFFGRNFKCGGVEYVFKVGRRQQASRFGKAKNSRH